MVRDSSYKNWYKAYESIVASDRPAKINTHLFLWRLFALSRNMNRPNADVSRFCPWKHFIFKGWQLYDEHWYRLFEVDLMWVPAENFCRSMGGHLVSIKDEAENDFVDALRKSERFMAPNVISNDNRLSIISIVINWSMTTCREACPAGVLPHMTPFSWYPTQYRLGSTKSI